MGRQVRTANIITVPTCPAAVDNSPPDFSVIVKFLMDIDEKNDYDIKNPFMM